MIDFISDKPVAFNRDFVALGVGITGALFLSQCVYWAKRLDFERDGWFYKTQQDWEKETGMTRREQESARTKLVSLGFLEEKKQGIPCKIWYRINSNNLLSALNSVANKSALMRQTSMAESAKLDCTKAPYCDGGMRQTNTENTTENTAENTYKEKIKEKNAKTEKTQTTAVQAPPPHSDNNQDAAFLKASIVKTEPKGLSTKKNEQWLFLVSEFGTPEQVAKDFMQTRKAALTTTSLNMIIKQAGIANISVSAAIEFAAGNAWQTFTAEYYANRIAQSNKQSAKPAKQSFSLGCDNSVDWAEESRKANEMHLKRRGGIPMTQQEEDDIPF